MSEEIEQKNIIMLVSLNASAGIKDFKESEESSGYRLVLLYQNKPKTKKQEGLLEMYDVAIRCNLDSPKAITQAIKPYENELLAITCRGEGNIPAFQKVIPHVPYLRTPTTESLEWSTNKLKMRRRFNAYDHNITPKFTVVQDSQEKSLKKIEEKVGFPLIIKPVGLASSLLVSVAYYPEELEQSLKKTLRKIQKIYKEMNGRGEPEVLVEQFIDGNMYSVDAHIGSRGAVYFNPFVHIKTGRSVGFDDFFGYQQSTPAGLNKNSIKEAQEVSIKAIRALKLRSTTAHIELLQTEKGWKVIEVGPRMGGFRHLMYKLSYGINTAANDIAVRIPKKLCIPKREKGYTTVLKTYSKKEGAIKSITGVKKVQELKSFYSIKVNKKVGDKAIFAKNGGKEILRVTLFNEDQSELLADVRRYEKMIKVKTGKS
ncbi:MAG: ATP-grasp domain-containing protein [Patescibacteria group bacterium]